MKRILIAAALLVFLSSCTPAPVPAPTATATATKQPTATLPPQPTATITPEPTDSPQQIADSLGLRSEPLYGDRTFSTKEINGATYLIDEYNNAAKAVLEGGAWRRLDYTNNEDAETMYGALVPGGGEYIHPGVWGAIANDPDGFRSVELRYLGDWEVEEVDYDGKQVNLLYLLAGLRDGGGRLHVVRIAYDSLDLEPRHMTGLWCLYDGQSGLSALSGARHLFFLDELPEWFRVGEEIGVDISEKTYFKVGSIDSVNPNVPKEWNNAQTVMLLTLFNTQPDIYSLSASERGALDQYQWPDRPVTLAPTLGVGVRRASKQDCEP